MVSNVNCIEMNKLMRGNEHWEWCLENWGNQFSKFNRKNGEDWDLENDTDGSLLHLASAYSQVTNYRLVDYQGCILADTDLQISVLSCKKYLFFY